MTKHYQKLNQFARRKLKDAQAKLKEAKGKRPAQKEKKGTLALEILASVSEHVAEDP